MEVLYCSSIKLAICSIGYCGACVADGALFTVQCNLVWYVQYVQCSEMVNLTMHSVQCILHKVQCIAQLLIGSMHCNGQRAISSNGQWAISSAVANGLKECADAADTRHRARLVLHLQCNTW